MPRDSDRLLHALTAAEKAIAYCQDGRAALDDERTLDAVLHCLTVVGEALSRLSSESYDALTSVPQGPPRAQRNLIVHEYWRIDPENIWHTVSTSLPSLIDDLRAALHH